MLFEEAADVFRAHGSLGGRLWKRLGAKRLHFK